MVFAALSAPALNLLFWSGLSGLLLLATAGGFAAGVSCAGWIQEWSIRRATRQLQRLFQFTLAELDRAGRLCQQLGDCTHGRLSAEEWKRLEDVRDRLSTAWRACAERQAPPQAAPTPETACVTGPTAYQVTWRRQSLEGHTQLPDRSDFDANFESMLALTTQHCQPSGLLLVRMDKRDQLVRRYGEDTVAKLDARLVSVVLRAVRDEDLLCRLAPDLFAVLVPSISPLGGARLAEAVRSAVRQHHFRAGEAGPELLVTASFGYVTCCAGDAAALLLDRAEEALAKSQAAGRNQLHVHDASHRGLTRVA